MVIRCWRVAACAPAVLLTLACKPDQEGRPSLIDEPRILAVQAVPAEAKPGDRVEIDLLRFGPEGRLDTDQVDLDFCIERKPIASPGVIAADCLDPGPSEALVTVEPASPRVATLPEDACSIFGPKPPPPTVNEPAMRPVDPDVTGGFYQPLRVLDDGDRSVAFIRTICGLPGTTPDNVYEFGQRYRANGHPAIEQILFARQDDQRAQASEVETPIEVARGERIRLAATWAACPVDEQQCGDGVCSLEESRADCAADCAEQNDCSGAETFLLLDATTDQLRLQRETIRISWYVTGGTLDRDRSGRSSEERSRDAQNVWGAPDVAGEYWLVAVIRDDRGGVGWTLRRLRVSG